VIAALGCANQHRRGHGGSSALSADIAEEDALAVSWQDAAAVEVVTDLADGVEGHVNAHTGHGIKDARREHALYLLGGLHFPGQNGALAGGLLLLAKQEEEQRDHQAEDRDRLAVGNSVGPMCLNDVHREVARFQIAGGADEPAIEIDFVRSVERDLQRRPSGRLQRGQVRLAADPDTWLGRQGIPGFPGLPAA
jgi:hypothetical protein